MLLGKKGRERPSAGHEEASCVVARERSPRQGGVKEVWPGAPGAPCSLNGERLCPWARCGPHVPVSAANRPRHRHSVYTGAGARKQSVSGRRPGGEVTGGRRDRRLPEGRHICRVTNGAKVCECFCELLIHVRSELWCSSYQ